jgi:hypothetical protein
MSRKRTADVARKHQKKLERLRRGATPLKKGARKLEAEYADTSLLRLAASAPFGPCWLSTALDHPHTDDDAPALLIVVTTRRIGRELLGEVAIVDRAWSGVVDALLLPLLSEPELRRYVATVLGQLGELRECEPLEAQSVLFRAFDCADSLEIAPHSEFELALFEPRPGRNRARNRQKS